MIPNIDDLDVVIRRKNEKYSAFIPQIGVTGSGASPSAAIDDLEQRKKSYIEDLAEAGLVADVVPISAPPIPESPIFPSPVSAPPTSASPASAPQTSAPLAYSAPRVASPVLSTAIGRPSLARELAGFGLKTLILVSVIAVSVAIGANAVVEKANAVIDNARVSIREISEPFENVGGRKFWGKVETNISELAERDLPEAQKQRLLAEFRAIVQKWRPFVAEAQQLFAAVPPAAPNQTK